MRFTEIGITVTKGEVERHVIYYEADDPHDLYLALSVMGYDWFTITDDEVERTKLHYPNFSVPEEQPHPPQICDVRQLVRVKIPTTQAFYGDVDSLLKLFPHVKVEALSEGQLKALHRKLTDRP